MTARTSARMPTRERGRKAERIAALLALLLIAAAWVFGALRAEADLMPHVRRILPDADHFVKQDEGLYAAWVDETETDFLGYVAIGTADGYGGPLQVAVALNPSGEITGAVLVGHKENGTWVTRVLSTDLLHSLVGKRYTDPFQLGTDVESVAGATRTSGAIAKAVANGSRAVADLLRLPTVPTPPPRIIFGVPEIVLLGLFAIGYHGHRRGFRLRAQTRWVSMLVGMIVLGFIYTSPITLAHVVRLILGYWPQWQTNLYWYFLVGGILFVFTAENKNPYCQWFCPFGAAQECMGVIGGGRARDPGRYREMLKWLQRIFALAAILLGIFFRSPGLASYELFGTLFDLRGSSIQFTALGLVLIAALFLRRPWCNHLCPMRPVVDLIRVIRGMVQELWQSVVPKKRVA